MDGTLGGGGYAEAFLEASAPEGEVLGLDWDEQAIKRCAERLGRFGERVLLERASYAELPEVLERLGWGQVDGVALDLGVSSYHLDDPERGFSFLRDGPLDMRMDRERPVTAADLVNELPERDLADLIYKFGEERWSRRIARAIVNHRKCALFSTTGELAELIASVVPKSPDSRRLNPATRTFQALRVAVNGELEALRAFLDGALSCLKPGGRLCIVSFHSLEDRMVKTTFREWTRSCRCPKNAPICSCGGVPFALSLTKKAIRPTPEELALNPRSGSAKLRAVQKI